jgi:hypothetical protein
MQNRSGVVLKGALSELSRGWLPHIGRNDAPTKARVHATELSRDKINTDTFNRCNSV